MHQLCSIGWLKSSADIGRPSGALIKSNLRYQFSAYVHGMDSGEHD